MSANDDTLRSLIRLIRPASTLKEDLEKSIILEIFAGTGDLAIKSFNGLQSSVAAITNDPYIYTLNLTASESATDKEKVSLALLAAGQLAAYLEGQTGLSIQGGDGDHEYHTAPNININNIAGVPAETINKILAIGEKAMEPKPAANE